jgi:hypothetical protein
MSISKEKYINKFFCGERKYILVYGQVYTSYVKEKKSSLDDKLESEYCLSECCSK